VPTLNTFFGTVLVEEENLKRAVEAELKEQFDAQSALNDPVGHARDLVTLTEFLARPVYEKMELFGLRFAKTIADGPVSFAPGPALEEGLSLFRIRAGVVVSNFNTSLRGLVAQLLQAGVAQDEIVGRLLFMFQQELPPFNTLVNGLRQAAATGVQHVGQQAYLQALASQTTVGVPNEADEEWVWVTVGDSKVCPDCESRHNQIKSLLQWRALGLPKSGHSRCGERDRCLIMPAQFADEEIDLSQPVKLTKAKVAEIGERAAELGP